MTTTGFLMEGLGRFRRRSSYFKLYSQAKLGMMREALAKLDREANERLSNFRTGAVQ